MGKHMMYWQILVSIMKMDEAGQKDRVARVAWG